MNVKDTQKRLFPGYMAWCYGKSYMKYTILLRWAEKQFQNTEFVIIWTMLPAGHVLFTQIINFMLHLYCKFKLIHVNVHILSFRNMFSHMN